MVHYCVHKSPSPVRILSHMSLIEAKKHYFPKTHFSIIISSTPSSSDWSLPFRPSNQNFVCISNLPMRATCNVHLILIDLISLIIYGNSANYGGSNILLCTLFSNTLNLCFSLTCETRFHTHTKQYLKL
jgi:hypothetical protein